MMIKSIFLAITQGLSLANNLTSGENAEKRLHVAMRKNVGKALNIAEEYFDAVEEHMDELPTRVQRRLRNLARKFNKLD